MTPVWMTAACRTAVVPKGGAFAKIEAAELASATIRSLLKQCPSETGVRLEIVLGNALYGGGNPARVAALLAGLDEATPAITLDSQCCSGLDAIAWGASRIASGQADVVIAGGVESYSRAPLRYRRPASESESAQYYARPPFSPWADRDPDLIASAAALAIHRGLTRRDQELFAIDSHHKALGAGRAEDEIVAVRGVAADTFSRNLQAASCARLPGLAGEAPYDLTAATIAVEADAAAAVLLVGEQARGRLSAKFAPVRIVAAVSQGFAPDQPALAATAAAAKLLQSTGVSASDIAIIEIMEAFAAQAMTFVSDLELDMSKVNRGGGALARGHPIGASGAILAVRLFHELQREKDGAEGLAAIAAAGGLGSALLLCR